MKNIFNKKFINFIFLFLMISIISFNLTKFSAYVTDRELLILSRLSYYNGSKIKVDKILEEIHDLTNLVVPSEMKGWEIVDKDINISNRRENGFSAIVFKKGNDIVIALRGSDGGVISENFKYLLSIYPHPQVQYLKNFIKKIANSPYIDQNTKIYTTGHSLGGYLSLYAAAIIVENRNLHNCLEKAVTFATFGLNKFADKKALDALYSLDPSNVKNYRIEGDVISCCGEFITTPVTLNFPEPSASIPKKVVLSHQIDQFFLCPFFKTFN